MSAHHPSQRVALSDDGETIALTLFAGSEEIARTDLDPLAALHLGSELVNSALRRLQRAPLSVPIHSRGSARGGDAASVRRANRDNAIRDLARAISADLSLERQAEAVIRRACRYHPLPGDPNGPAERQALHRIASSGLPVPGKRQARRILSLAKQ